MKYFFIGSVFSYLISSSFSSIIFCWSVIYFSFVCNWLFSILSKNSYNWMKYSIVFMSYFATKICIASYEMRYIFSLFGSAILEQPIFYLLRYFSSVNKSFNFFIKFLYRSKYFFPIHSYTNFVSNHLFFYYLYSR